MSAPQEPSGDANPPAAISSNPESTALPAEQPTPAAGDQGQQSTTRQASVEDQIAKEFPLSSADGVIKKPFGRPLDDARPIPPPQLTSDQQSKYETVLKTVSGWTTVPTTTAKNAPTEQITEDERMFLTRECLLRYLRACKWNVNDATARLRSTLAWRREYGIEKLTADYISPENETGKQVILGYDINGRPCLYLVPSRQNTEKSDRQIQHLVFMLERVIDLMPPGQESLALMVDFKETKSGQNATIGQSKQTISILQNHYPERLGRALVTNVPFMIWGFFKVISPFLDPVTREKLKFNEDLRRHVPPTQLLKSVGGEVEFEYDHSIYWPALNKLVKLRQTAYRERWVKGGKLVGEHEDYLKGGAGKSLAETQGTSTSQ
ncbi:hypothetical protein DTO212C5_4504 [Paecilomyces variotii]|nr:hypothetical protein DTO212C5_4504 [Paecilomyces variotii]